MKIIITTGSCRAKANEKNLSTGIGYLLSRNGLKTTLLKIDPFLNYNTGMMDPNEQGEIFVCGDGSEVDQDLGIFERTCGILMNQNNYMTLGNVLSEVISEERHGAYHSHSLSIGTAFAKVLKERIKLISRSNVTLMKKDGTLVEVGTPDCLVVDIGSIPSNPELLFVSKAIADVTTVLPSEDTCIFIHDQDKDYSRYLVKLGMENNIFFLVTNKETNEYGVFSNSTLSHCGPFNGDFLEICNTEKFFDILKRDLKIFNTFKSFDFSRVECTKSVLVGIVTYAQQQNNPYCCVEEALVNAGLEFGCSVSVVYISVKGLEENDSKQFELLKSVDALLMPGGFEVSGLEGKLSAVRYARENRVPFLGICLGFHMALIEIGRNVIKIEDATSQEFERDAKNPVVRKLPNISCPNTGRGIYLGNYMVEYRGEALNIYDNGQSIQRYRHRYGFNLEYKEVYEANGVDFVGKSNFERVAMFIYRDHPCFLAVQYHPELTSTIHRVDPVIKTFIKSAIEK